jgi:hypothetical protein
VKWSTTFGVVEVVEQVLRLGRRGVQLRPFCEAAGVEHRCYSQALERVLVDFGAEHSFAQAAVRVREHYRIEVPIAAIRQHTLQHGRKIATLPKVNSDQSSATLITQMDGSMIPVMQPGNRGDGRKGKRLFWREARLCVARDSGRVEGLYGATMGSAETAAWLWQEVVGAAGCASQSYVHGLGDGADWIVGKFTENFGHQGRYLVDFYHVSEYLAAAAKTVARQGREQEWRRRQQGRLLNNQTPKVLRTLQGHLEPAQISEAPVRSAHGYLSQRRDQLDYAGAREKDLPIG